MTPNKRAQAIIDGCYGCDDLPVDLICRIEAAINAAVAEEMEKARASVLKFISARGHELCHENRGELAHDFGIELADQEWPALPSEAEFERRCKVYREELYGPDGP